MMDLSAFQLLPTPLSTSSQPGGQLGQISGGARSDYFLGQIIKFMKIPSRPFNHCPALFSFAAQENYQGLSHSRGGGAGGKRITLDLNGKLV